MSVTPCSFPSPFPSPFPMGGQGYGAILATIE
jgi:hypothetical protein